MRILAVDDDPDVLQALVTALGTLPGHQIRSAGSGNEAFELFINEGGTDLLVTDVVMEGVDGLSLRNELRERSPELRTIFLSGYDLSEYAEAIGDTPLLAKPLDLGALRAAVQSELARLAPPAAVPQAPVRAMVAPEPEVPAPVTVRPAPAPEPEPVAPALLAPEPQPIAPAPAAVVPEPEPPAPEPQPIAPSPAAVAPEPEALAPEPEPPAPAPETPPAPVAVVPAPVAARPVPVARPAAPTAQPSAPTARPPMPSARPPMPTAAPAAPVPVPRPAPVSPASPAAPRPVPAAPKEAPAVPKAAPRPAAPKATSPSGAPPLPTMTPAPKSVPRVAPTGRPPLPTATPVPKAMPVSRPAGAPVPSATPRAAAAPPAPPAAPPAPPVPPPVRRSASAASLQLLGQTVGGYQIVSLLGEGRWGPVFAAVQVAINRPVGLKVLDPELAADADQKQRFIADARAKANVQHPSILAVYEAGAAEGWIFFTQEFVDGQNLAEMAGTGARIDQPTALRVLRAAAEGAVYFEKHTTPHSPLSADSIYLGADGQARLSNPATQHSDQPATTAQEIESIGRAVLPLLPPGPEITVGLRTLLGRTLSTHESPITSWGTLLQGIKSLEPKVVPVEAERISAQDRAAVEAVENARRQQKRTFLINVGAMVSLFFAAILVWYFVFIRSNERHLTDQVHIPAGEFISGDGVNSTNPEFWIDKYEVTIGQYAKFLQWIEANPADEHQYDHKQQKRNLSHKPQFWDIYYLNAVAGKAARSIPVSLNSPAITVTWWDAYAYAKWKGRELPTALEWERAARGTKGSAYPWGEEPDLKRANTNADFQKSNPGAKGNIDGFNFWGDVDRQPKDKSPDGVIGMAGNVSEWTNSWTKGNKNPILKGGNFSVPLLPLLGEITDQPADASQEFIGFRTISHTPPEK